jgi:hypothetical protein
MSRKKPELRNQSINWFHPRDGFAQKREIRNNFESGNP